MIPIAFAGSRDYPDGGRVKVTARSVVRVAPRSCMRSPYRGRLPMRPFPSTGKVRPVTTAKFIVAFVAIFGYGGLFADAVIPATARQHLWNPNWASHAKLHNGQTMLLGILNGTLALVVLFGLPLTTLPLFFVAVALAAFYWVALLLAPLFPGTAWCDPEFLAETPQPLGLHPQQLVSWALIGLLIVASGLALAS
jgi:hypothetical protein